MHFQNQKHAHAELQTHVAKTLASNVDEIIKLGRMRGDNEGQSEHIFFVIFISGYPQACQVQSGILIHQHTQ